MVSALWGSVAASNSAAEAPALGRIGPVDVTGGRPLQRPNHIDAPLSSTDPDASKPITKPRPRRISPSAKSSRLPEWPPSKRSVFSDEVPARRKPSVSLAKVRSARVTTNETYMFDGAQSTDVPPTKRRVASTGSGSNPPSGPTRRSSRPDTRQDTGAEEATAARLLSLPTPPAGDPEGSSPSPPSTENAPAAKVDRKRGKTHRIIHEPPKKRLRDEQKDTSILPKHTTARKKATAGSAVGTGRVADRHLMEQDGALEAATPKRATRRGFQASGASAQPKARGVSSTVGKRTRGKEQESQESPPKRARTTRSAGNV